MTITVTDTNRAVWEQRLADAEDALNRLMLGAQEVELSYDGETIKFQATSENRLRRWIAEIRAALAGQSRHRAPSRAVSFR